MSQENVEIVRRSYEHFNRTGELDLVNIDPACEFVTSPDVPDAGTYRGEKALRWNLGWIRSFSELTLEPLELLDAGDHVVVRLRQRGRLRGAASEVAGEWWFVHTLRSEKIIRVEVYPQRSQALEAVGLRE
jgi:ketosteroid isomerase-like protein